MFLPKPSLQPLGPQRSFGRAPDVDQSQMGGSLFNVVVKGRVVLRYPCLCGLWVDRTCMVTMVHPCRVKSFRKAVSAVMDDLDNVPAKKIIEITVELNG